MSNATPETRTIQLNLQDELAVCLVVFEILPMVLQHHLSFDDDIFHKAVNHSFGVMASMIEDDPALFRKAAFNVIHLLARVPDQLGRRGVSIEEAIAAFKGDGSCPDGVDPENWESLVQ
jgi:hypothetical protein